MPCTGQASALLEGDEFVNALDSVADSIPVRRGVQGMRPEQQPQAWMTYAASLEARVQDLHEQLARSRAQLANLIVCRGADRAARGDPEEVGHEPLVLLARVRAEQLMCVRLLNLLARCERLDVLADVHSDASAVLDARRRRDLRQRDFEDSLTEQMSFRQAALDELARSREGARATRLREPAYWRSSN